MVPVLTIIRTASDCSHALQSVGESTRENSRSGERGYGTPTLWRGNRPWLREPSGPHQRIQSQRRIKLLHAAPYNCHFLRNPQTPRDPRDFAFLP